LTEAGRHRLLREAMPPELDPFTSTELQHRLEQAIWVQQTLHVGKAYVVSQGQVRIVDEFTGRVSANRKLGNTLHQAIEAKEGLELTPLMRPAARMTVQDFASQFSHLCGITGTAKEASRELDRVYGLAVRRVPPHFASRRVSLSPRLATTMSDKWQRITAEVVEATGRGRSVLVGTRTVVQSEELSRTLDSQGVRHVVLNARNPEREAEIVAQAGVSGRVTVATNMAGRGTDIRIDDASRAAGGLHVIVSEPHAAARIDRQMIGRAGRQGDPGSAVIFGSAEDEILRQALGVEQAARIALRAKQQGEGPWLWRKLRQSQRIVENRHRRERAALAASDLALAEAAAVLGIDLHLDPLPE
jgi:preprotein translocase subunit SecA